MASRDMPERAGASWGRLGQAGASWAGWGRLGQIGASLNLHNAAIVFFVAFVFCSLFM